MGTFLDPRSDPSPERVAPAIRVTDDPDELEKVHDLCREGRLYAVERWIKDRRPLQLVEGRPPGQRRFTSALKIALEEENHALVHLLLCNGYDPNREYHCSLNLALESRRWDLLDLLLKWGADPHRVSLTKLFGTYQFDLFEQFRKLGVDLTADHTLAETLACHTLNKPLFGFARPGGIGRTIRRSSGSSTSHWPITRQRATRRAWHSPSGPGRARTLLDATSGGDVPAARPKTGRSSPRAAARSNGPAATATSRSSSGWAQIPNGTTSTNSSLTRTPASWSSF